MPRPQHSFWEHCLVPLQGSELAQPIYVTHPLQQYILDAAQRVCGEYPKSITQQMWLPVLEALLYM